MLKILAALSTLAESVLGLAGSVNALSATVAEANGNVRRNLALDPPALPEAAATTPPAGELTERKARGGKSAA